MCLYSHCGGYCCTIIVSRNDLQCTPRCLENRIPGSPPRSSVRSTNKRGGCILITLEPLAATQLILCYFWPPIASRPRPRRRSCCCCSWRLSTGIYGARYKWTFDRHRRRPPPPPLLQLCFRFSFLRVVPCLLILQSWPYLYLQKSLNNASNAYSPAVFFVARSQVTTYLWSVCRPISIPMVNGLTISHQHHHHRCHCHHCVLLHTEASCYN